MPKSIEFYRYVFKDNKKMLHPLDIHKQGASKNSNVILKRHNAGTEIICNQKIHLLYFLFPAWE